MPEYPLDHIAALRQQYRHKPRLRTIPALKKVQKSKMSEKKCIFANSTSRGQPPQPRWDPCGYGVIGSRARLRIWFFTEWGFESPYPHLSPQKSTAPAALFLFPALPPPTAPRRRKPSPPQLRSTDAISVTFKPHFNESRGRTKPACRAGTGFDDRGGSHPA